MTEVESPATTYNLLFVCSGNTCRSPLAQALARRGIERRGWNHVAVRSAGSSAVAGAPASSGAVEVARRRRLDLGDHRASPLDEELVGWADLILTMGPSHQRRVEALGGEGKSQLLKGFAHGTESRIAAVSDPFGGGIHTYEETFDELEELVDQTLERLRPILAP